MSARDKSNVINRTLTGNWRLRSRERVWGRPWVIFEVEERVTGQPVSWLPYYVDKTVWRPASFVEAYEYMDVVESLINEVEKCINRS